MKTPPALGKKSAGFAAAATLAVGAIGALPAHAAFASSDLPSASVLNGTLFVSGTNAADAITIGLAADPTVFLVHFGDAAAPRAFDRSTFDSISVALGNGDDTFSVDTQGQFSGIPLTVDGGRGQDRINGSRGADVLIGAEGDDTIRGNDGDDLIEGNTGNDDIDGERGADTELLGSGDDTATWLPGEASDIVEGGSGADRMVFVGAAGNEVFGLSANGTRSLLTRDLGGIRMDMNSIEDVDLSALGGTDTVNVGDLTGTDVDTVNLDLSSAGQPDGQLDVVNVDGTDLPDHVVVAANSGVDVTGLHTLTHITGNDTRDLLRVSTGRGDDSVVVTDAAAALINFLIDLGVDQQ